MRRSSLFWASCAAITMTYAVPSLAYETPTHDRITRSAFAQSVLRRGYLQEQLGLSVTTLFASTEGESFTPEDWLATGSIREDDNNFISLNPFRYRHHFYDPVYDRGLTGNFRGSPVSVGRRAFEWALEDPDQISGQDFSWREAHRYFLNGLTASSPRDREAAMASTFRALGQVIHLIQDMGVPEHTRNDWHAGVIPPSFPFGTPSVFEHQINERRTTLTYSGYSSPQFPHLRHFWTTGDGRGLAEFTNRNFVSKDTNFTEAVDGNTGRDNFGRPYPLPRLDLSLRTDVDVASPDAPACSAAAGLSGKVTFFGNDVSDVVTGEVIRNKYLTTYSLFDDGLKKKGQPGVFSLNFCTIDAAAAVLLPRATGYSAALIDYFFRGKLDVDLVPADPTDPSIVRVTGTNAAQNDALVDGEIGLYADDLNGKRTPVAALDPVAISSVPAAGSITSSRFRLPPDAERFMVVYKGTLGNELKQANQNNPGAVIGKVLGGVRVEEIVNDGTLWKLRTPKGIFGLTTPSGSQTVPLTVAQYEVVKWGDTDSALVARTRLDAAQPTVVVYDVPRKAGSAELDIPAGATDLVLTQRKSVAFPSTAQLTTVNFTQTVAYRQHMARADATATFTWSQNFGSYQFSGSSFSGYTFQVVYEQTIPFTQSFPVILDIRHNSDVGSVFDPYYWQLQDISVDAGGRPLGLVVVYLDRPTVASATVPFFRLSQQGGLEQSTTKTISPYFPEQIAPLLWALVDLERGTVVASTAGPVVTINSQVVDDALDTSCCVGNTTFWVHYTVTYGGRGPADRTEQSSSSSGVFGLSPGQTLGSVTDVTLPANGEQSLGLDGWLRGDLRDAMIARGRYTIQPVSTPFDVLFIEQCDTQSVCSALRIHQARGGAAQRFPGQLLEARRPRPVAGNERLVFLSLAWIDDLMGTFGYLGDLLVWDPDLARAQFIGATLDVGFHDIWSATGSAALVTFYYTAGGYGTLLYGLDPAQAPAVFPSVDLSGPYTLLEPSYLYSTADLKFHRTLPALDPTALPATLAGGGSVTGDYHALKLP